MAESSLMLKFGDFVAYTGDYLGWGKGVAFGEKAYDTRKLKDLTFWVASGVRQFYVPPILPGERTAYSWSFLNPSATLTAPTGATSIDLPDDFGGFVGPIGLSTPEVQPLTLNPVHPRDVYQARARAPNGTGSPQLIAVEPVKGTTAVAGQRWRLLLWPTTEREYTFDVRYKVTGEALTGDRPFVYGGPTHAETVLASCVAAAELFRDNTRGPRYEYFIERLAASVSIDRELKPYNLGYNRDASDGVNFGRRNRHFLGGSIITVNGQEPI